MQLTSFQYSDIYSGKWVCGRCKLEKKSPPASKDTTVTLAENPSNKKGKPEPVCPFVC